MPVRNQEKGVVRGDPGRTRELILRAALREFAEHGYGGARIEAIAGEAGVNKQALYYHFDSKDGLYKATVEFGYRLVRSFDPDEDDDRAAPGERLAVLISSFFDTISRHQEVVTLVAEENRLQGKHLRDSTVITELNAPFVERVRAIYRAGVEDGSFRSDIDPDQLWITIVSVAQFYFSNAYTISHILKANTRAPEVVEERKRHVVDFVLAALRPETGG